MTPTISICMAAYNSEKSIDAAINSVINQSYKNWELIIVDDCSTDKTYAIISEYQKRDSRIKVFKNIHNIGSSGSRNRALDEAKGRFISFLDSDDELFPEFIESQLCFMSINNCHLCTASYIRKTQKSVTTFSVPKETNYKKCCKGNPMSCLTTVYDRDYFGEVRFDSRLLKSEDWDFWLNLLKTGCLCLGNTQVLGVYNIHSGSKNRNKVKLIKYNYYVLHRCQKIPFFKSLFFILCWAFYGLKKYKNVR